MERINEFLIAAKKSTYADEMAKPCESTRLGSYDYEYSEVIDGKKYVYHDTYFGGKKFLGSEVVYIDDIKPKWGMNYYGVSLTDDSESFFDSILRPALMRVGEDSSVIPIRGPREYVNGEFTYKLDVQGDLTNFEGTEFIYKNDILIFKVILSGGIIE